MCTNMKNNLQKIRWDKNWTQQQLSRISHVPQSVISDIENGLKENPSVFIAIRLARALSVTVEDIFTKIVRKTHSFRGGMDSTFIL